MAANDNNNINYKVNWPLFIQDPDFGQTGPWASVFSGYLVFSEGVV
jgi:hypothetical protein